MNKYCANLATMLKVNGGKLMNKDQDGNPVEAKITDYERVIIVLSVLGKNPANFYGCNLLEQLADYDAVTGVGINAVIYALLALDAGNSAIPTTKSGTQATRKMYLDYILKAELPDGGFNWGFDDAVDPDLTGMAITALAPYRKFRPLLYQARTPLRLNGYACLSSSIQNTGVSIGEETKIVAKGKVVNGLPIAADKSTNQQQER